MHVIYFTSLGAVAFILSMIILTQFMNVETAIYYFPFIAIPIITVFLSVTGTRFLLIPTKAYRMEKRDIHRYKVDHYSGEITLPNGDKINVLLNDISSGGFQISCVETAGKDISEKINQLKNIKSKVELTANIPFHEKIEQIKANCKIAYVAKNNNRKEKSSYVAGLEVTEFKDNGDETFEMLLNELALIAA